MQAGLGGRTEHFFLEKISREEKIRERAEEILFGWRFIFLRSSLSSGELVGEGKVSESSEFQKERCILDSGREREGRNEKKNHRKTTQRRI